MSFVTTDGLERVQLVDAHGSVRADGLRALTRLMNPARIRTTHAAHPRLALLLTSIARHFGDRPVRIVSGYRAARRYTHLTSRHTVGRATDIHLLGVPHRRVWDYCRSLYFTGCGIYPDGVRERAA